MEACANTDHGSEHPVTRSSGPQVTGRSDDTGSYHARETSSIANDTRDDTAKRLTDRTTY